MKKWLTVILILVLLLSAAALAKGIDIKQEAFYVVPYYEGFEALIYGEIENTSDRVMEVASGIYEIFDSEDESIDSGEIYSIYPKTLQPGEKAYLIIEKSFDDISDPSMIADYTLSVTGKSSDDSVLHYDVSDISVADKDKYGDNAYVLSGTITNNSDDPTDDIYTVFAAHDADGNLLFVGLSSCYGISLLPGSSGIMHFEADDDLVDYLNNNGLSVTSAEAVSLGSLW